MNFNNSSKTEILLSGINPFDRSNHEAIELYDTSIIVLLVSIINSSMKVISSPLVTQLQLYEKHPNAWVIEQLVNGTAEISSTTLVLTPQSDKQVDYSIAVGTFRPQIFYKAQSIRMANNIYFIPFSSDTWLAFGCLILFITMILTFILARETRLPHNTPFDIIARIADEKHEEGIDWKQIDIKSAPDEMLRQRERWEIGEIFLVIVGAVCQQGSERDPSTMAARILLLALFIHVVLAYTAFSASVISLISLLPKTDQELHSGWNVAKNATILVHDTNFFRYEFMVPANKEAIYLPMAIGLKEAIYSNGIFVGDKDPSSFALQRLRTTADQRCSIGRSFLGTEYQRVFAIRKGSKYTALINYNILKFRQYGLLSREKRKAFNNRRLCGANERAALSGFVSVDYSDVRPALQLIAYGWALAAAVLFFEHFIHQCCYAIEAAFGEGWTKGEHRAQLILERWIKKKTIMDFQANKKLLLNSPKKYARGNTMPMQFLD